MTFKHTKFEDSPTMRALEKVAKEKGLVKTENLQKKAAIAKKADYTPTSDLMENILKLCAGLRASGLEKEAIEVETSYLNYKRAQTLYETSKEKGEDLIQSAHPKGSHKLEGVEGDEATIEDIIDQHLKMMKSVEKKPTGKLSSHAILNAVKVVLAQEVAPEESEEELSRQIIAQATKIIPMINSLIRRLKEYGGANFDGAKADKFGNTITSTLAKSPIGRAQLNIIADNWKQLITWARGAGKFGGDFGSGLVPWQTDSEKAGVQNWNANIAGYVSTVLAEINKLPPLVTKRATIQFMKDSGTYQGPGQPAMGEGGDDAPKPRQGTTVVMSREAMNIFAIANNALSDLTRWQGWINMKQGSMKKADFDTAMAWLKSQYAKIDSIKKQFTEMGNDPERQNREAKEFTSMLNTLIAENKEFREAWFQ